MPSVQTTPPNPPIKLPTRAPATRGTSSCGRRSVLCGRTGRDAALGVGICGDGASSCITWGPLVQVSGSGGPSVRPQPHGCGFLPHAVHCGGYACALGDVPGSLDAACVFERMCRAPSLISLPHVRKTGVSFSFSGIASAFWLAVPFLAAGIGGRFCETTFRAKNRNGSAPFCTESAPNAIS